MNALMRILNLEDSANDADLNKATITARWPECQVVRTASRDEFIAALEQGGFDIILSDFTLPGFGGQQALDLAREKRPEVPFLFVSGTIEEDTAVEALKNGATDFILKHRLVRLIPSIERALREVQERTERRRAEESMRQSEHKYREVFECLSDAAFLADEETGKIIDTNRRAETLLGCTRAQILGSKQSRFLALEKSRPYAAGAGASGRAANAFNCDMLRVDGGTIPVEVSTTRLTLYGRPLVLQLCHELTAR